MLKNLTEADYISTPSRNDRDHSRLCHELGVKTSKGKHEKCMDEPIELFRINVAFKTKSGKFHNVHRNERVKTDNTRYFILDEELAANTVILPPDHPY